MTRRIPDPPARTRKQREAERDAIRRQRRAARRKQKQQDKIRARDER